MYAVLCRPLGNVRLNSHREIHWCRTQSHVCLPGRAKLSSEGSPQGLTAGFSRSRDLMDKLPRRSSLRKSGSLQISPTRLTMLVVTTSHAVANSPMPRYQPCGQTQPPRQRQLGGLEDGAAGDTALALTRPALPIQPTPTTERGACRAIAGGADKARRPARGNQRRFTLVAGSGSVHEPGHRQRWLKLHSVHRHGTPPVAHPWSALCRSQGEPAELHRQSGWKRCADGMSAGRAACNHCGAKATFQRDADELLPTTDQAASATSASAPARC